MQCRVERNPTVEIPKHLRAAWRSVVAYGKTEPYPVLRVRAQAALEATRAPPALTELLTVAPKGGGRFQPKPYTLLQKACERFVCFPRGLGLALGFTVTKTLCVSGEPLNPDLPNISLRPYQRAAVDSVCARLSAGPVAGGLLVASCGAGKTVMGLEIVRRLGRRAAVVVHKDFLMQQWAARIRQFLPGAKVGIVQRDVAEVDGCDIVLCMIQTLAARAGLHSKLASIGIVLYDETHHICAKSFCKSLSLFPARMRLGLTATPDRADGLGDLVTWMVGPVVCRVRRRPGVTSQ